MSRIRPPDTKKGKPMKKYLAALAILAAPLAVWSGPGQAQSSNVYFHCELSDSTHDTVYFSGIFTGYYGNSDRYSNEFTDFIHSRYPNTIGTADCYNRQNYSDASSEKAETRDEKSRVYNHLIETGWTGY